MSAKARIRPCPTVSQRELSLFPWSHLSVIPEILSASCPTSLTGIISLIVLRTGSCAAHYRFQIICISPPHPTMMHQEGSWSLRIANTCPSLESNLKVCVMASRCLCPTAAHLQSCPPAYLPACALEHNAPHRVLGPANCLSSSFLSSRASAGHHRTVR